MAEDRLTLLCEQDPFDYTGIDFVAILDPEDQHVLRVFFIVDQTLLENPMTDLDPFPVANLRIWAEGGGTRIAEPEIVSTDWNVVAGRTVLDITVAEPGDHSIYILHIDSPFVDHFFNDVRFSFKQGCPSVLDCRRKPEPDCPPALPDFVIDPMARDFASIRRALIEHATTVDPDWTFKSDADVGIMLIELMAALGDELNYVQDRFVDEGSLEQLTQRRSARLLARLLDYEIHDGRNPSTVLELTVSHSGWIDAGTKVWAHRMGEDPIPFEIGEGLADRHTPPLGEPRQFWVHEDWNSILVYEPDSAKPKLAKGATELYLIGEFPKDSEVPEGEFGPQWWVETNRALVIHEQPEGEDEVHVHLVHVTGIEVMTDVLTEQTITRITWSQAEALPCAMVIADLRVNANIVPATAGETFEEFFSIRGDGSNAEIIRHDAVVERQGPLDSITGLRSPLFRYSPVQCESRRLGWLGELRNGTPEIDVQTVDPATEETRQAWDVDRRWEWRRTLLDSIRDDAHFTLEDGTWRRIIAFPRPAQDDLVHRDWAANAGYTIRFGDGEFGMTPTDGTVFRVRYRSGPGRAANVASHTIVHLVHPITGTPPANVLLQAVTNPFDVTTGVDPESIDRVKLLAPEAFKHDAPRAVRPEDYIRLAETLPWVQRADAMFRWTGSWLTVFVAIDPVGAYEFTAEQRGEIEDLMDCVRQIGRDVVVLEPDYIDLDLQIGICTLPGYYQTQVESAVLEALAGSDGFFANERFSFETPLRRSALEATIQSVAGVRSVESIMLRARELTEWRPFYEAVFAVGPGQILRVLNDPNHPEYGTVVVHKAEPVELIY
jgi:hypothetical protein